MSGTPPWRDGEPPVPCPRGCGRTVHWNPCETAETKRFDDAMAAFHEKQRRERDPMTSSDLTTDELGGGESMVERVARALCGHDDLDWDTQGDPFTSGSGCNDQAGYLLAAHAAIAAMRIPTDKMITSGSREDGACPIWEAMIDAALKPESP